MSQELSGRLLAYLTSWHSNTVEKQIAAGNKANLSLSEFIGLFAKRQLASLQKAIDDNRLRYQQSAENPYAYVATWKSYAARSTGIYDVTTACICSRMKSAKINLPARGDELRASHRANIADALTGKAKTAEHREAIGQGCRGVKKEPWSAERKAARSALRCQQETAKL